MNNIISFNLSTPDDVAKQIAARVKARRLELNLTQEGIATRAGLKFATYRRFEQTGEISLKALGMACKASISDGSRLPAVRLATSI